MKIEVKRIGAVIVGDQLIEFKGGVEVDGEATIEDAEGHDVGNYEGGILAGRDKDDKEWFVSLHDVRAIRMR
jgi:hypothetical protein